MGTLFIYYAYDKFLIVKCINVKLIIIVILNRNNCIQHYIYYIFLNCPSIIM